MKRLLLLATLLFMLPARGADFEIWSALFVRQPIHGNWVAFGEVQNRMRGLNTYRQLLARAAIGYQLSKRHTLWFGYGWTPLFFPATEGEHRIWQQALTEYKWDNWELSFRFRFEQRWIDGKGGVTAWRWREQIKAIYNVDTRWGICAWNEFLFNIGSNSAVPLGGFAQNRFFLGVRLPTESGWSIEPGYMNVITRHVAPAPTETFHVATVYVSYQPPQILPAP